jgi:hypothetical protein
MVDAAVKNAFVRMVQRVILRMDTAFVNLGGGGISVKNVSDRYAIYQLNLRFGKIIA